jgi:hypothetical protein
MDEKMIEAYDRFHTAINEMRNVKDMKEFCTSDASHNHYLAIRKYLNVHELIAVGIGKKVLDRNVCYHFWCDTLTNGYRDAQTVLDYVRSRPGNKHTYSDLVSLNDEWLRQMAKDGLSGRAS